MNVVDHGILPILALAMLAIAAVSPLLLEVLTRRVGAVAMTGSQRPRVLVPMGVLAAWPVSRRVPTDVVPANQAWRAPPTVRALSAADDPATRRLSD